MSSNSKTDLSEERCQALVNYLRGSKGGNPEYPPHFSLNDKRGLRQQSAAFDEKDGVLFHRQVDSMAGVVNLQRVVSSKDERVRLMRACHDGVDGSHYGRDKTLSKLTEGYYWKGMTNDVHEYCKSCDTCQRVNPKMTKQRPELHPIPVTDVWNQIGIDLVGPLPETVRGNKYIVTVTDYFTKWPEAAPLPDKTALGVADFLYSLFCRHGWPNIVLSDQGREFVNEVSRCLFERTGVEHRISSPYHPQTNGLDERTNQTLVKSLVKLSSSTQDWDIHIEAALYAYRISRHDSSRYSPFFLLYNRHPRKAIDYELAATKSEVQSPDDVPSPEEREDIIQKLLELRGHYQERARTNIKKAQEKQKEHYDAKHDCHHEFAVGSVVLLKVMKNSHRMGGKLDAKWKGPYEVLEKLSKGRYRLKSQTGTVLKKLYNGALLKDYRKPCDETAPPRDVTAPPRDVTAPPRDVTAPPRDVTAPPRDVTDPVPARKRKMTAAAQRDEKRRKAYPHIGSLQSSTLGETLAFEIQRGEFVQILNMAHSHWITVSNIGCPAGHVQVFDSLPSGDVSLRTKEQIAALLCTKEKTVTLDFPAVQIQRGGSDCGAFAVAFATSLCAGESPATTAYHQPSLRTHLMDCLEKKTITTFAGRKKKAARLRNSKQIEVYCCCRQPENGERMVECDGCHEWFHELCIVVPKAVWNNKKREWFCCSCK